MLWPSRMALYRRRRGGRGSRDLLRGRSGLNGRGTGIEYAHNDDSHQNTRRKEQKHAKAASAGGRRTRGTSGERGRRCGLWRAGIGPIVESGSRYGRGSIGPPLRILAHTEAAPADGIPHARLGEIQLERSEFETAAKAPSHDAAILTRQSASATRQPCRIAHAAHQRPALSAAPARARFPMLPLSPARGGAHERDSCARNGAKNCGGFCGDPQRNLAVNRSKALREEKRGKPHEY